jgi:hypothetical protein
VQTTWGGFKLDDVMSPLSVFRAARTSSYTAVGESYISLDKMLLNAGNAMAQCNNTHLVVQRTGVYFVSWSAASPPNITQSVFLYSSMLHRFQELCLNVVTSMVLKCRVNRLCCN